jgi:hypothetical protein
MLTLPQFEVEGALAEVFSDWEHALKAKTVATLNASVLKELQGEVIKGIFKDIVFSVVTY